MQSLQNNVSHPTSRAVSLADQGYFWVGLNYEKHSGQTVLDGNQMYVEYQIPATVTREFPIVLIHGGGGQGLDWISTPDGRPGWRTLLLQQGYEVYIVDRPGHGRAPTSNHECSPPGPTPSVEELGPLFAGANNPDHDQWPGNGHEDDPALAQLLASQGPMPDLRKDHQLMQQHGSELLERIGPSILMTSSAGGPAGWLIADARPELVAGIIALEPLGPSGPFPLSWGLASVPLHFRPEVHQASLDLVETVSENHAEKLRLQREPARQLPHLVDIPIAIVTGDQSFARSMDIGTVAFLKQAGCRNVHHLKLNELGVFGNGHLMMIERNNAAILEVLIQWLDQNITSLPVAPSKTS